MFFERIIIAQSNPVLFCYYICLFGKIKMLANKCYSSMLKNKTHF